MTSHTTRSVEDSGTSTRHHSWGATGLRSLAWASRPTRCASSGRAPPTANGSWNAGSLWRSKRSLARACPAFSAQAGRQLCQIPGPLQHLLGGGVLPLHEVFDELEQALPNHLRRLPQAFPREGRAEDVVPRDHRTRGVQEVVQGFTRWEHRKATAQIGIPFLGQQVVGTACPPATAPRDRRPGRCGLRPGRWQRSRRSLPESAGPGGASPGAFVAVTTSHLRPRVPSAGTSAPAAPRPWRR